MLPGIHVSICFSFCLKRENTCTFTARENLSRRPCAFHNSTPLFCSWTERLDYFQASVSLFLDTECSIPEKAPRSNIVGPPQTYSIFLKRKVVEKTNPRYFVTLANFLGGIGLYNSCSMNLLGHRGIPMLVSCPLPL